ncbi:MAG TPA: low temperature requirement protein A [Jiangellaceae bacterium]|jgi:low temperature requirement protein LtrA|nr:low temperature requirement protein A [Jiangellaceae bacterium]
MTVNRERLRVEATDTEASVTPLELFFDLVFVLALTQVTAYLADHLSSQGVIRGLLLVAVLWWSWTGYAWLGNVVRADEGVVREVMLAAMATMFIFALAIPEAFDDLRGGLYGPVVVPVCYLVFRLLHLIMFWIVSRDDPGLRRQVMRFAPSVLLATAILLVAAGTTGPTQTALWGVALAADYVGTLLGGASGWRLPSATHFAERHGLIVIVALGESIVAIGVGIAKLPISWPIIIGSLLGLSVAAALWWVYFDVTAAIAERALAAEPDADRPRMARDAYSYLHLPLIAGIVLLALGMKKVLEYVGGAGDHDLSDPLTGVSLYALVGGVVLYLVGHVAFKWRTQRELYSPRLIAAAALLALTPLLAQLPALASLAVVALVSVGLVGFETVHHAELRSQIRHEGHQH